MIFSSLSLFFLLNFLLWPPCILIFLILYFERLSSSISKLFLINFITSRPVYFPLVYSSYHIISAFFSILSFFLPFQFVYSFFQLFPLFDTFFFIPFYSFFYLQIYFFSFLPHFLNLFHPIIIHLFHPSTYIILHLSHVFHYGIFTHHVPLHIFTIIFRFVFIADLPALALSILCCCTFFVLLRLFQLLLSTCPNLDLFLF